MLVLVQILGMWKWRHDASLYLAQKSVPCFLTFGSGVPAPQSSCGFISAFSAKKFGGDLEHMLPVKEIIKRGIG